MLKDNNNLKATPKEKLKGKLEVKMKEKKQMVVNKKKQKGKEITEGNRASHTKSSYTPPPPEIADGDNLLSRLYISNAT